MYVCVRERGMFAVLVTLLSGAERDGEREALRL